MRALIVNFGARDNLGCLALLEGEVDILRRVWPEVDIRVMSPEREDEVIGLPIMRSMIAPKTGIAGTISNILTHAMLGLGLLCRRKPFLERAFSRRFPRESAFLDQYTWCDVVVNTGGDVLTEDYGLYSLAMCVSPLAIGLAAGKRVVLLGETIGPFTTPIVRMIMRQLLKRVTQIFTRESWSYDYLKTELRINMDGVVRMPDPSFAIAVQTRPTNDAEIGTQKPIVCIVPSALVWRYFRGALIDSGQTYANYVVFLKKLVDLFTEVLDNDVVIASHVKGDSGVCLDLSREIQNHSRVRLHEDMNSSQEVRSLLSRCQFLVTFRMHSGLAGLAARLPTVFIGYSQKFEGITTDISGSNDWFIDVREDVLDEDWMARTLGRTRECWNERDREKALIANWMDHVEGDFAAAAERLRTAIGSEEVSK